MLWYWADWNSGTVALSRFLKGCYMDLLHAQFNTGRLSLEEIKIVLGSDFGQAWPTLQKKFTVDKAGKYFNERLELEKNKRAAYTASRRKNLESSHMETHMDSHTAKHMDNINQNANAFQPKKESLSKIDIMHALFDDKLYLADLTSSFKGKDLNQAFDQCYRHHSVLPSPPQELWEWKQKLNTWLINMKSNDRNNPKTNPRRADATIETADFGKL